MSDLFLSRDAFDALLASLRERDDRLEIGPVEDGDEPVDAYALSAHVEALRAEDIDGDVWGTLEDLEMTARDEDEAWAKIRAWYLERGCVALFVGDEDGARDEYLLAESLARRLKLL